MSPLVLQWQMPASAQNPHLSTSFSWMVGVLSRWPISLPALLEELDRSVGTGVAL